MKALTILQPWASLIACGAKKIETRSWATKYRGPLAIHAGKGSPKIEEWAFNSILSQEMDKNFDVCHPRFLLRSCVIAIADLVDCQKVIGKSSLKIGDEKQTKVILENQMIVTGNELEFGDFTPGRYARILANVRQIEPVLARGKQRIWEWEGEQHG